jgi:uncharacterized protein (DUF342 family)
MAESIQQTQWPGEREPALDVSEDGMAAWLEILPAAELSAELVAHHLTARGVTAGIDRTAIEAAVAQVLADGQPRRLQVATGALPIDAEDGRLEFKFTVGRPAAITDGVDATDTRETGHVLAVQANQLLALAFPASDGVPGTTVTGKPLRPKRDTGHMPPLTAGCNVRVEGTSYLATCDGMVIHENGSLQVLVECKVPGDLDFSVGNIRFSGPVTVGGSVLPGFVIEAGGPVVIGGNIDEARVTSGGDVTVHGGILGSGQAEVVAGGQVQAQFIEHARIEAGGDVIVKNYILHSNISTNGRIRAVTGKGAIIGGTVRSAMAIEVREIGSETVRDTHVSIGAPLKLEAQLARVRQQIEVAQQAIDKIDISAGSSFRELRENPELLQQPIYAPRRAILQKLIEHYHRLEVQTGTLADELSRLEAETLSAESGTIVATTGVFEGSTVSLGRASLTIAKTLVGRSRFTVDPQTHQVHIT